jgi:hypothetical protein
MSCHDRLSNTSLIITNAKEVDYEGLLSDNTKITENCVNQHEVNEDIYLLIDETIEKLGTSTLGELSVTFPSTLGVIAFQDVIKQYEIEIASLKTEVQLLKDKNYCDLDITSCNINFGTLSDNCASPITTLGAALQALFNQANT